MSGFRHFQPLPIDSIASLATVLSLRLAEIEEKTRLVIRVVGTPEGQLRSPVGTIAQRTDGGIGTTFYVKESGTENTGWVAK